MSTLEIVLAAAAGIALIWFFCWWILPARELVRSIGEIAQGKGAPLTFFRGPRMLEAIARDLEKIRERQEEMGRQIENEGFSLWAILASMEEGVLIVDGNRRIRLVNATLIEMFDLQSSPINRTVMEVFHSAQLNTTIAETLKERAPQRVLLSVDDIKSPSGNVKYFEVNSVILAPTQSRNSLGAIAVFHDVTELRSTESARQELVANVSHELRTPLSIIQGYVETLLEGGIEDKELATRFLQTMQKHSERLNFLIEDLMTLSKLESGQEDLKLSLVSLRECALRVIERLEPTIETSKAIVNIDIDEDLVEIEADPDRIDQVFFNLIDNALKYSIGQQPQIEISARAQNGGVTVDVADNGPGIPIKDQPQIFERFYRIQKDRSRDSGGTGLGLSIVKHIILAHGGAIGVSNRTPRGTVFTFRLPVSQADN